MATPGIYNSSDKCQVTNVCTLHSLVFLLIVSVSTRVHGFKHDYILIIGRLQTFLDCNTINGLLEQTFKFFWLFYQ